ncbi:MAG: hypothetical protein LWW87_10340 [Geobacteraceae bacterium]|nr:hypothetical protein [Geobacteraceae bacterium]
MSRNSNSNIFRKVLNRLCEIEESWQCAPKISGQEVIFGLKALHNQPENWQPVTSVKCLPYLKLKSLLSDNRRGHGFFGKGREAVLALDSLPCLSGFSVYQVIEGCAQSLRFANQVNSQNTLRKQLRYTRKLPQLRKNAERVKVRSIQMFKNAMTCNANVSLAGNVLLLATQKDSAKEITELSRNNIQQHKYGCIYYQTDRLNNHVPTPAALLAINLEWIFRHWPLLKETYPTWPARKQPRGRAINKTQGPPRRDLVAHFLNVVFPHPCLPYTASYINDSITLPPNATFCGW